MGGGGGDMGTGLQTTVKPLKLERLDDMVMLLAMEMMEEKGWIPLF